MERELKSMKWWIQNIPRPIGTTFLIGRKKKKELIWKLLTRMIPKDPLHVYWYNKEQFYALFKTWPESYQDWVIGCILDHQNTTVWHSKSLYLSGHPFLGLFGTGANRNNKTYRFFNKLMHAKDHQNGPVKTPKGFVHHQPFLMRLVWVNFSSWP